MDRWLQNMSPFHCLVTPQLPWVLPSWQQALYTLTDPILLFCLLPVSHVLSLQSQSYVKQSLWPNENAHLRSKRITKTSHIFTNLNKTLKTMPDITISAVPKLAYIKMLWDNCKTNQGKIENEVLNTHTQSHRHSLSPTLTSFTISLQLVG